MPLFSLDQLLQSALFILRAAAQEQSNSARKGQLSDTSKAALSTSAPRYTAGMQCYGPVLHILSGLLLYRNSPDSNWIQGVIQRKNNVFSNSLVKRLCESRKRTFTSISMLAHFLAKERTREVNTDPEQQSDTDFNREPAYPGSSVSVSRRRHRLSVDTVVYGTNSTPASSNREFYSGSSMTYLMNLACQKALPDVFEIVFNNLWHGRCYSDWNNQEIRHDNDEMTSCAFCFNACPRRHTCEGGDDRGNISLLCDICEMRIFMIGLCAFPLCGPSGKKSKISIHNLVVPQKAYTNVHPDAQKYFDKAMNKRNCMLGGLMIPWDAPLPDNQQLRMCDCTYCSAFTYVSLESHGYTATSEATATYSLIDHIIQLVRNSIPIADLPDEWSIASDNELHNMANWKFVSIKQQGHGNSYITWNQQDNVVKLAKRLVSIICPTFTTVCNTVLCYDPMHNFLFSGFHSSSTVSRGRRPCYNTRLQVFLRFIISR